ncbi:MAG: HK97 family phage prohead protease [Alphaproteobacteria bacterium]|nr:HK97 family phage prohead protease [Alphaproteobacteria bacterium]
MPHSKFDTPLELKFLAETGVFEGYASVFHVTDSVNDRILPGAFKSSLEKFRKAGSFPPLLWQHDTEKPIGAWREMYEDEHGLFVKGELFVGDLPRAREAHKLLKENVVTGLSIGYRVKGSSRDEKSGARILTVVDLLEVSLVTFPANKHARVLSVKKFIDSATIPSEREFESFLHGAGFSRKQSKGVVAKGYRALLPSRQEKTPEKNECLDIKALALFRASIIQATEDNKMAALKSVFPPEKKAADIQEALRRFSVSLCHATEDNFKAGFNTNHPYSSTGNPGLVEEAAAEDRI